MDQFLRVFLPTFEIKRSKIFRGLAQKSLGLKSETNKLVTITYSKLLITMTGINCQMSLKFGYIVHFALELLAYNWEVLKSEMHLKLYNLS